MKISEIAMPLREAIPTRPRTIHYWRMRERELQQIQAAFEQAITLFRGTQFPDSLRYSLGDAGIDLNVYRLEDLLRSLGNNSSLLSPKRLIESLGSYIKYHGEPAHNFYQYIPSSLKDLREAWTNWREIVAELPTPQQVEGFAATSDFFNPQYLDRDEIIGDKRFVEIARVLFPALRRLLPVLDGMAAKVKAQEDFVAMHSAHQWERKPLRPKHDEVETLYHATAYVNEIVRSGFTAEKPEAFRGVGNLGTQEGVSVTHDLKIATDIMRCLKELTMIANRQLKARTIADWIRRERIPNFPWHEFMQVYRGQNEYFAPIYDPTTFDQFSIEQTALLYNKYIWLSRIHPNPVFISVTDLVQTLVGRAVSDSGILACQIRLDPADEYHDGESEFRVSQSRVLSVKRIM